MGSHLKSTKALLDTSPFFGGTTHLGWVAADALIIPVRVDQHSMQALKLTLAMLKKQDMDFLRLNSQAGIKKIPKVHAIVMTHCGWNRQAAFTPDRSTQAYLTQVLDIAYEHADVFSCEEPLDAIHLWMIFIPPDALADQRESRLPNSMLANRTRLRGKD